MINSLSLTPFYRETWGFFDPPAIAQLSPLAYDQCYEPKYYKGPDDDQEIIPANGYLKYGLEITPGSLIWGIYHRPPNGYNTPGFVFSLTSMDTGIVHFDHIPDMFVGNVGPGFSPWLLNAAIPVVGKGLFNLEFWNATNADLRCNMIFTVCELPQCQY